MRERDCVLLYTRGKAATNDKSIQEIIIWHNSIMKVSLSGDTQE